MRLNAVGAALSRWLSRAVVLGILISSRAIADSRLTNAVFILTDEGKTYETAVCMGQRLDAGCYRNFPDSDAGRYQWPHRDHIAHGRRRALSAD
jgi:hypothetical protein